ncbi:cytochrome c [Rhizoctonia solani]|nr:cytochrome c [Rhizoctonia solani]
MPNSIAEDFKRGAELFASRCAECHSIEPNKASTATGAPNLSRLFGSQTRSNVVDAKTQRFQDTTLTWDEDTINKYLKNPESIRPGVEKIFEPVTKEQDRKDLIAYLKGMRR